MTEIPHFGFIVAAFAIAGVTIVAMVAVIWWDYRDVTEKLARLETRRAGAKR